MKYFKTKTILLLLLVGASVMISSLWAADHIDAPSVASTTTDITDFYAFQSPENTDNLVLIVNSQGLLSPSATGTASFDEQVLFEFNIDQNGDAIEDLVIQTTFEDGMMKVYGPATPLTTGNMTMLATNDVAIEVPITPYGSTARTATGTTGVKVFAGPRDDPFFMDFAQYNEIIAGNAPGFNDPGSDTFAGTNVMSVVIELPKSLLGAFSSVNTWVEAKRVQ
ncbi:MAG: DUF4331 family protein [Bacteroidota bacterium]